MKKSERLNQELIFLKDKKSFQLRDLIDGFAISKRTALRDIAELEALGVPLYTETGRWEAIGYCPTPCPSRYTSPMKKSRPSCSPSSLYRI